MVSRLAFVSPCGASHPYTKSQHVKLANYLQAGRRCCSKISQGSRHSVSQLRSTLEIQRSRSGLIAAIFAHHHASGNAPQKVRKVSYSTEYTELHWESQRFADCLLTLFISFLLDALGTLLAGYLEVPLFKDVWDCLRHSFRQQILQVLERKVHSSHCIHATQWVASKNKVANSVFVSLV
jgi:hypothetical protein